MVFLYRDTRFAHRAARENDGFIGFAPRVGLADSANPGLTSSTPLGSSHGALRAEGRIKIYEIDLGNNAREWLRYGDNYSTLRDVVKHQDGGLALDDLTKTL